MATTNQRTLRGSMRRATEAPSHPPTEAHAVIIRAAFTCTTPIASKPRAATPLMATPITVFSAFFRCRSGPPKRS